MKGETGQSDARSRGLAAPDEPMGAMTMKIERDLQDHEPRLVTGVVGVKSRPFRRRFANVAKFDAWLDAREGDVEIYQVERV